SIHLNDWDTSPGAGTGADSEGVTHPALPDEAPCPKFPLSTTMTSRPRRRSSYAESSPMTPPPMTIVRAMTSPLSQDVPNNGLPARATACCDHVARVRPLDDGSVFFAYYRFSFRLPQVAVPGRERLHGIGFSSRSADAAGQGAEQQAA